MISIPGRTCWLLIPAMIITFAARAEEMRDERAFIGGVPVLDKLPSTTPEFKRRARDYPILTSVTAEGGGIYAGLIHVLLGDRISLRPAPHTPWAKPLAGGKRRVITISTVHSNYDLGEIQRRLDYELYHIQVFQQYYYPK